MSQHRASRQPKGKPWNPRFVQYARFHGRDCEAQRKIDIAENPGAMNLGFTQWNMARLREAAVEISEAFYFDRLASPKAYDAWLVRWVDKVLAAQGDAP